MSNCFIEREKTSFHHTWVVLFIALVSCECKIWMSTLGSILFLAWITQIDVTSVCAPCHIHTSTIVNVLFGRNEQTPCHHQRIIRFPSCGMIKDFFYAILISAICFVHHCWCWMQSPSLIKSLSFTAHASTFDWHLFTIGTVSCWFPIRGAELLILDLFTFTPLLLWHDFAVWGWHYLRLYMAGNFFVHIKGKQGFILKFWFR